VERVGWVFVMGKKRASVAFPVARIKKMMQSDEDVGKIATGAPLLVAKALEVVLEDLIRSAAGVATQCKARTISPQHLKQTVFQNEAFDFLHNIFEHVPALDQQPPPQQHQHQQQDVHHHHHDHRHHHHHHHSQLRPQSQSQQQPHQIDADARAERPEFQSHGHGRTRTRGGGSGGKGASVGGDNVAHETDAPPAKRKRGRPPKNRSGGAQQMLRGGERKRGRSEEELVEEEQEQQDDVEPPPSDGGGLMMMMQNPAMIAAGTLSARDHAADVDDEYDE